MVVREVVRFGEPRRASRGADRTGRRSRRVNSALAADRRRQLVGDRDRGVEPASRARAPTVRNCTGIAITRMRGASRSSTRSSGGSSHSLGGVREAEAERALARRRIEVARRERGVDERLQVRAQRRAQPLAAARQREAAPLSREQRRTDGGRRAGEARR